MNSISTNNEQRDGHLKSGDFFNTAEFPTMTFEGTSLKHKGGDEYVLDGNLTMHGVTHPVTMNVEHGGVAKDPWGNVRTGFTIDGKINRKDFGLNWNAVTEAGGLMVSEDVKIHASVQFVQAN